MYTEKNPSEKSVIIFCLVLLIIIRIRDGFTGQWAVPEEIVVSSIVILAVLLGIRRA